MTEMRLVFDVETNGYLADLDRIHSLVIKDIDTGEVFSWGSGAWDTDEDAAEWLRVGLNKLSRATVLIGHNIIKFDIPAIQKVYPDWTFNGTILDTLVMARLMWPDIKKKDKVRARKGTLPGNMIGRYGLEAFGYRLGNWKGDYAKLMKARGLDPWAEWNPEMQEYCEQDVEVTHALWDVIQKRGKAFSEQSIELEHKVQAIIWRQQERGFAFNEKKAEALYADLVDRRAKLDAELRQTFGSWEVRTPFTPKSNNSKYGYVKGVPTEKVKVIEFNPASTQHMANRLKAIHGWEPSEFTPCGDAKMDETVLASLDYPEAKLLLEYLTVKMRIGQLAEGKQAWLKKVRNGRIHGTITTNGAVTGRMTHSSPNMSAVPANYAPYGERCRELFEAGDGYDLVGSDADALELCCLAGYMARYDGGAYIKTVLEGDKSEGTDIHSVNARALGMDPKALYRVNGRDTPGRDIAKTWFYAFIYGSGDKNLGAILGKGLAAGKKSRATFLENLPALDKLIEAVKDKARRYGAIRGLDGRRLYCRSLHSALNTLLQGAGAVIMKQALVVLDENLIELGLVPGVDYEFVANSHDEWQKEVLPEYANLVGERAVAAITIAGELFNFPCPLSGSYSIGKNWSETH